MPPVVYPELAVNFFVCVRTVSGDTYSISAIVFEV